ncbi:MAG TPA: alpha/beta fold hydrolase [Actinomycetota bacterium]|nr:alpha/beta fold hydrolase [Actinomycetota bacterium]
MSLDLPELRTAYIDGPVAFREWEGPQDTTFVLVHGLGGSHVNWLQVAPGLAGLGRVIALDLPGFGSSPRAGRGSGLMDERRALSRFVAGRATGRVVLVGNSMGGVIGILHAAVEPGSIAGLVLTNSPFPWVRGALPHPVVIAGFAAYDTPGLGPLVLEARMRRIEAERAVRLGFRLIAADPSSIPEEIVRLTADQMRQRARDPDAPAAFQDAWRSLRRLGCRPDVARRAMDGVRCPVFVVHGRRDRLVPAAYAEAALREHPTWRARIFPDLGHVPQMEAPSRWLTEVADWYAEALG